MNINTVRITGVIAGVLLTVGLLIGFLPVRAAGASCGSAFVASNSLGANEIESELGLVPGAGDTLAACSDARSGRLVPAVVFLVLGGIGLVATVMMGSALNKIDRRRPTPPAGPVGPYGQPPWPGQRR